MGGSTSGVGVEWHHESEWWGIAFRGIPIWLMAGVAVLLLVAVFVAGLRLGHRMGRGRKATPAAAGLS